MKVFVTIVRGLMHKRTERIELEPQHSQTEDLLEAVARRLMLHEDAFRLIKTEERHNLRIVRGWPLSHYEIETGCTLSLTIDKSNHFNFEQQQNGVAVANSPLQRVEEDPEQQLQDASISAQKCRTDSLTSMSTFCRYVASKSSMRMFLDHQLQRLLEEATIGTLEGFSMVLREHPNDTELLRDMDHYERSMQHLLNQLGESGWAVLHCAVFNTKIDLVEFLLIKGADPNLPTVEGWTSLMLAIKSQNMKIARILLGHPLIKVNQVTKQGTALCLAVEADLVDFAEVLFEHKANERIAGRDGVLPSELFKSPKMEKAFAVHQELESLQPYVMRGEVFKQTVFYTNQLRYLVCDPFEGTLARYQQESHYPKKPIEVIPLKDILEVRVILKSELQWLADKSLFYFEVYHPQRSIYCTESKHLTEVWVEAIFRMVAVTLLTKGRKIQTGNKKVVRADIRHVLQDASCKNESVLGRSRGPSIFGSVIQKNSEVAEIASTMESPTLRKLISPEKQKMDVLDLTIINRKRTGTEPGLDKSINKLESTCNSQMRGDSRIVQPMTQTLNKKKSCVVVRENLEVQSETPNPPSFLKKWKSAAQPGIAEPPLIVRETVKFSSFEIVRQLGNGAFGRVFLAKHKLTNKMFALKALVKRSLMLQRQMRYAIGQANILRSTDHPFVVKLWYAFQTQLNLYMCLDYCSCGDLSEYLAHKEKLSESEAKWIIAQLLLALQYLHSKNILYRDLKPENILLHEDGYIRLADFGLSKADNVGLTYSFCGSPAYLSPEMITQRGVGKEADIYGVGCVLHEMLLGEPPHFAADIDQLYKNIREGRLKLPASLSENARDLLKSLLQRQPTRRISIAQAKSHAFFRQVNFAELLAGRCGRVTYQNLSQVSRPPSGNSDSDTNSNYESFSDVDYEPEPSPRVNRVLKFSFDRSAEDQADA